MTATTVSPTGHAIAAEPVAASTSMPRASPAAIDTTKSIWASCDPTRCPDRVDRLQYGVARGEINWGERDRSARNNRAT